MNLESIQEKGLYLTPILFALFVFFLPLSPSLKSIFFVLGILSVLFNPKYNQYLGHAYNTYWGRAALLLVVFVALACFWSPAPIAIRMSVLSKYCKLLYLPILAVGFIQQKTRIWCINAYLLSMVVTFIAALLKIRGFIDLGDPTDPGELFYNHIVTGFMMALACYLAAFQFFKHQGWLRVSYAVVVLSTSYQVLFLNTGRTGYVIYIVLMGLFLIQKLSWNKALLGLVLLCCMMFLAYSFSPRLQNGVDDLISNVQSMHLSPEQNLNSLGYRLQFHDYAATLFVKHPIIGLGTGAFQYQFSLDKPLPLWGDVLNDPHSQYWLTLAEQGIIGAGFLILFLVSLFFAALQLTDNKPILLGVLIAFCTSSFFDSVLCYSTIGYLLIILSSLCFGEFIEHYARQRGKIVKNREMDDAEYSPM